MTQGTSPLSSILNQGSSRKFDTKSLGSSRNYVKNNKAHLKDRQLTRNYIAIHVARTFLFRSYIITVDMENNLCQSESMLCNLIITRCLE